MSNYDTNQMSISLGAQLFLTHFVAAGSGLVVTMMMASANVASRTAVSLTVAALVGLLLNWNIQRTLRLVDWVLRRMVVSLPVEALTPRGHGPLTGLVAQLQQLISRERPFHDLYARELQQAGEMAAQEERQRLARDLHDSIKQQLFSIQVSAAAAQVRWEKDMEGAKTAVSDIRDSAQAALVEVNALLQQLAQHPLETVGLAQALREQAEALAYRTGADVAVNIAPLPDNEQFPPANREALFRIAQEAMGNIARHARANHVIVALQPKSAHVQLRITDDGQGFDETAVTAGMGLDNMRQRAAKIGGTLTIDSQPGQGTTIQFLLPLIETIAMKEKVMLKPDHTINRVGLIGIGGGVAAAAALFYPLYVLLPGRYLTEWPAGSSVLGTLSFIVALLLVTATGFLAAWQANKAGRPHLGWGAAAGGVAGIVAFLLVGGSAMTLLGAASLLLHGLVPSTSESEFMLVLVNSTTGVIWWSYLGFGVTLLVSVVLGTVGGWLARGRDVAKRPLHTLPLKPVWATIFFAGTLSSLVAMMITIALTAMLGPQIAQEAENLGWQLGSWPIMQIVEVTVRELGASGHGAASGVLYPPLSASILPIMSMMLVHIGFLVGLHYTLQTLVRQGSEVHKRQAITTAYQAAFFSGIGILLLPVVIEDTFLQFLALIGAVFIWVMCIFLVRLILSLESTFFNELGEPMGTWGWLRKIPLLAIVLTFPMALVEQSVIGFWLMVITAVLTLLLIPRNWQIVEPNSNLSHFFSALVGDGLAFALPLTVLITSALGLITLVVFSIARISFEPEAIAIPAGKTAAVLLREQVQTLYLYNGYAFLAQVLFVVILLGIVAVVYRLMTNWRH